MKFQIILNSIEDVLELVNKLEHYDCKAEAVVGKNIISARSFMGLIGLGMGQVLTVFVYIEEGDKLKKEISNLVVA